MSFYTHVHRILGEFFVSELRLGHKQHWCRSICSRRFLLMINWFAALLPLNDQPSLRLLGHPSVRSILPVGGWVFVAFCIHCRSYHQPGLSCWWMALYLAAAPQLTQSEEGEAKSADTENRPKLKFFLINFHVALDSQVSSSRLVPCTAGSST